MASHGSMNLNAPHLAVLGLLENSTHCHSTRWIHTHIWCAQLPVSHRWQNSLRWPQTPRGARPPHSAARRLLPPAQSKHTGVTRGSLPVPLCRLSVSLLLPPSLPPFLSVCVCLCHPLCLPLAPSRSLWLQVIRVVSNEDSTWPTFYPTSSLGHRHSQNQGVLPTATITFYL